MKHDRLMLASTLQSRGGKARAAALSPARRAEIAKKAAEARWAAFGRGEQSGERSVGGMFSAGAQQLEALAGAVGLKGAVVKVEPPKPKRPPPKAGTNGSRVFSVIGNLAALGVAVTTIEIAKWAELDRATTRAALAHLTTAGHVVSVPKPGSRREKLWRLA